MIIDCTTCRMRSTSACDDCVVTAILAEGPLELAEAELGALSALADHGLVPRLRLVPDQPLAG